VTEVKNIMVKTAKESRIREFIAVIANAASFAASVLSVIFLCAVGLFKAADAVAGFALSMVLCAALLFAVLASFYLAFGWFASIFAG
jgi:hypothetical protein